MLEDILMWGGFSGEEMLRASFIKTPTEYDPHRNMTDVIEGASQNINNNNQNLTRQLNRLVVSAIREHKERYPNFEVTLTLDELVDLLPTINY